MREGVVVFRVDWASKEAPDPAERPLSLGLYMHLRIFMYSSNILMASFERTDSMLASGL
jgi:hypothetical protein